jgi:hypothetical protein
LRGSVTAYLVGSVKIYLWVVGWFCLSPFCPPFRFISFHSSKLLHVSFLPLNLFFVNFLGCGGEDVRKFLGLNGIPFVYKARMEGWG